MLDIPCGTALAIDPISSALSIHRRVAAHARRAAHPRFLLLHASNRHGRHNISPPRSALLWSAMVSIPRVATMPIDARPWQILSLGLLLTYGMLVLGFDQAAMIIEIEIVKQLALMPSSLFTRPSSSSS